MSFNKRLLTVEDYNSIVEHFGKAVTDYYLLDTRILSSEYWFAYDFIEIYRSEDKIVFNIKNSLWTGGYYIKECNISNYTSSADSNTIIISGNGLEYVVLVLELSSTYIWNHYTELSFNPYYVPFIKPFYDELKLDIGFVNKTDEPVVNLPVWDNENREFIYTNNDGEISIIAPLKKA